MQKFVYNNVFKLIIVIDCTTIITVYIFTAIDADSETQNVIGTKNSGTTDKVNTIICGDGWDNNKCAKNSISFIFQILITHPRILTKEQKDRLEYEAPELFKVLSRIPFDDIQGHVNYISIIIYRIYPYEVPPFGDLHLDDKYRY